MKKYALYLLLLTLLSCQKEEETTSKKVMLHAFHSLVLNEAFEVYLIEGNEYSLAMEGAESFMAKMEFQVNDSILTIDNTKGTKWTNPQNNIPKLWVSCPQLKYVKANESCDIKTTNPITTYEFGIVLGSKANTANLQFDNEVVYYWNDFPCGGKLTLSGKTKELKLWNTAIMTVNASTLSAEKGFIENASKGDCIVQISNYLEYKIEGEGDIVVFGNPQQIIEKGKENSGQLILN